MFDNSVEKISEFAEAMYDINCVPECECFDTGIVRSCKLYQHVGILKPPAHISFIMGVQSGASLLISECVLWLHAFRHALPT